jgi:hypothetical protein
MVSVLERSMGAPSRPRRTRALALAAMCVGGMVVARAMDKRTLGDELRDACMEVALELGRWSNDAPAKAANLKTSSSARAAAL